MIARSLCLALLLLVNPSVFADEDKGPHGLTKFLDYTPKVGDRSEGKRIVRMTTFLPGQRKESNTTLRYRQTIKKVTDGRATELLWDVQEFKNDETPKALRGLQVMIRAEGASLHSFTLANGASVEGPLKTFLQSLFDPGPNGVETGIPERRLLPTKRVLLKRPWKLKPKALLAYMGGFFDAKDVIKKGTKAKGTLVEIKTQPDGTKIATVQVEGTILLRRMLQIPLAEPTPLEFTVKITAPLAGDRNGFETTSEISLEGDIGSGEMRLRIIDVAELKPVK